MVGHVRARMSMAVVRANTLLLRSPREGHGRSRKPAWEDGVGVSLAQHWTG